MTKTKIVFFFFLKYGRGYEGHGSRVLGHCPKETTISLVIASCSDDSVTVKTSHYVNLV